MTEKEIEKELSILRTSYAMYEKTKKETIKKRKNSTDKYGNKIYSDKSNEDTMALIDTMQEDIKTKYLKLGGNEAELTAEVKKKSKITSSDRRKMILQALKKAEIEEANEVKENNIATLIDDDDNDIETSVNEFDNQVEETVSSTIKDNNTNKAQYDMIPLPSGGQCYPCKKKKIAVAYLTAYDENIILSPNLYRDGTFLDRMIENKLLDSDISAEDLLPGDRDAIILWLRATGYGNEYPVKVRDNETNQQFETVVDLSKIKYKPFNLKGNKYGYFNYILPNSKDAVTFKFLSVKDLKALEEMRKEESATSKKSRVKKLASELNSLFEDDEAMEDIEINTRKLLGNAVNTIEKNLIEIYDDIEDEPYSHELTDRLIASIVGINKITDRNYIENYVYNMNIRDAAALRKYIGFNEPGLDYMIEVEKPESLGGGLMRTFLSLNEFIFIDVI